MDRNELISTVERAKQGNKEAFEKLYSAYYQKVYCFVLKNVGKKEAAEDITQDTFLRSMEKISGLENPEYYGTWLHSIAYNSCTDMFRSQKRTTYFESDEEMEKALDNTDLNEPIMIPEDYMMNIDRAEQLRAMIDSLKPDVRSAMIMYYYDDMNVSQVANALGMKENLAKQKLFRGRQKLKDKIQQLQESGILLCAMPVGEFMKNTMTTKQASAARAAYSASAHGTLLAGKVAGISAAAVVAVSLPFILHKAHNLGIVTDSSSAVHRTDIPNISSEDSDPSSAYEEIEESESIYEENESAAPAAVIDDSSLTAESETASSKASEDSSSMAEKKKSDSIRQDNLAAIDGSHVFTSGGTSKTFKELYDMGCANASDTTEGLAMAVLHTGSGAGVAYYTGFYTTDCGKTWNESGEIRIGGGVSYYFARDNGAIGIFRYSGADFDNRPTIQYINQTEGAPAPQLNDSRGVIELAGAELNDGAKILPKDEAPEDYAGYDFIAKYMGGNTLHVDVISRKDGVSQDEGLFVGAFDIDLTTDTYSKCTDKFVSNSDYDVNTVSSMPDDSSEAEKKATEPVDMSVDKLLSTSPADLRALSNDNFEMVQVQGQSEMYGFKCAAFPNYVFVVQQDAHEGKASGDLQVPEKVRPDEWYIDVSGSKLTQLELSGDAYIGDGVSVGMTYNEIKEALGSELEVTIDNSSMLYSAEVEIDGRKWLLHFDLTEEQMNEIHNRIYAEIPDISNISNTDLWETSVDISDMNPTCDIAVYLIY